MSGEELRHRQRERRREGKRRLRAERAAKRFQLFVGGTCPSCGEPFVFATWSDYQTLARYCSDRCRQRARGKGRVRPSLSKAKARRIFERDEWTCGICGDAVDRSLKWPDDDCAVVDHVVPLVHGGSHANENLQCAHNRCNREKGDRLDGDVRGGGGVGEPSAGARGDTEAVGRGDRRGASAAGSLFVVAPATGGLEGAGRSACAGGRGGGAA